MRSSTQPTRSIAPSLALSTTGDRPPRSAGRAAVAAVAAGAVGRARRASAGLRRRLEVGASASAYLTAAARSVPRRVEVLPDAAGELARVAGADRLELRGDAVAGPISTCRRR